MMGRPTGTSIRRPLSWMRSRMLASPSRRDGALVVDVAQPCVPVHGEGAWEHGAHASIQAEGIGLASGHWGLLAMRSDLPTMAEQFAAAGYRTVSVASNRFLDPKLGLTRGFEVAETIPDRELAERISAVLKEDDDRPSSCS